MTNSLTERKLFPLIRRVFYSSIDKNSPRLSALALTMLTRRINRSGEKRILFVGSAASLEDIDALVKYSGKYQYLYLKRFYFGRILRKYIDDPGLRENTYYVTEKFIPGREKVYACINNLFGYLVRFLRIDAIMSSNLSYLEQQELFQVAKDNNIATVILLREGMVHPNKADVYFNVYDNKRAVCDLFLCYNEIIKKSILDNNVPGLTSSNMKVTGVPRCDFYVREKAGTVDNQLVFFTFNADIKFKSLLSDEKSLERARQRTREFCHHVLTLAAERSDISVVCKTKPSRYYLEEMEGVAEEYFNGQAMPDNLSITYAGASRELVLESRWVLAICNSTTVLESLLANRTTGCPDYRDILDPGEWDFLEGSDELVSYIRDYRQLVDLVDGPDSSTAQQRPSGYYEVLNRYLYNTDGKASERVERCIGELLATQVTSEIPQRYPGEHHER